MIKSIEKSSVHRISSGQVLIDLQTAVKELVENSLDAGATTIDVKFKDYGLASFEVNDNGSGIAEEDYDNLAIKHYTSKLSTFEDLATVQTFGFRGEALSSMCAVSERLVITTATAKAAPMGTVLEFDKSGRVKNRSGKTARQRGTSVIVEGLFAPLPVRRKELERNSKREFGKALTLLSAYALVPCTKENKGVRMNVVNILDKGRKSDQIRTDGKPSLKAAISSLWGPKQFDSLVELNLDLKVVPEKTVLRRQAEPEHDGSATKIQVRGYISKFSPGCGRAAPDRQFFFINGRPCNPSKIQKAINEVYRSFSVNQSPFVVADFIAPTNSYDVNVSPDKRTILLHSENALVAALKDALETAFAPARSTFVVQSTQSRASSSHGTISKAIDSTTEASDVSENNTEEAPNNVLRPDDGNSKEADQGEPNNELLNTQGSPTPTMTVPASLLESKDTQAPIVEEDELSSAPHSRPRSPSPRPRGASPEIPSVQPCRRRPSPPTAPRRSASTEPAPVRSDGRSVQLTLDTSKASWSMRPSVEEPALKKRKLYELKGSSSRAAFRSQLLSFVGPGSQLQRGLDSRESRGAELAESMDTCAGGKREPDGVEDVGLTEEELEEMDMDPEADMDGAAPTINVPIQRSVTNNNKKFAAHAATKNPLFLPETDEDGSSQPLELAQDDPIDLDLDDHRSELVDLENEGHERGAFTAPGDPPRAQSIASEQLAESGTGVTSEVVRTVGPADDEAISFALEDVVDAWNAFALRDSDISSSEASSPAEGSTEPIDPAAGLSNTSDEKSAERELARVIDKEDFAAMEIVGQFNLGFIIVRRRCRSSASSTNSRENRRNLGHTVLDDLFIIDQHAADEKYNFETLQQTTKIDSQKLYQPRSLELTAADELLVLENVDILNNNGFEIEVDELAEPSQGRIKLVARPISGSTSFDEKDLEELIHQMQDRPMGTMVRCSKARAMFAMRACRKSVMIGMALKRSQMTTIVRHMGMIDQPWNCPHGRPTMRHLTSLNDTSVGAKSLIGRSARPINWENLW